MTCLHCVCVGERERERGKEGKKQGGRKRREREEGGGGGDKELDVLTSASRFLGETKRHTNVLKPPCPLISTLALLLHCYATSALVYLSDKEGDVMFSL